MNETSGSPDETLGAYTDAISLEAAKADLKAKELEVHLAKLGLSQQEIEQADLPQLKESLARVDKAIEHPEAITEPDSDIAPLLKRRRGLILNRIRNKENDRGSDGLKGLVASVENPDLRAEIERELDDLRQRAAERERTNVREQAEQIAIRDVTVAKLRTELLERKLVAWTGFFARESMATYIGAIMLLIFTCVKITLLFVPTRSDPKEIDGAFLLVLGYFFGQATTTLASRHSQGDGSSK